MLSSFAFCVLFGLISICLKMKFGLVVGGQRGHHIRYVLSKEPDLHWVFILSIFIYWKLYSFAFYFLFGLILVLWNIKFGLVVGGQRGQRGHHIRYAPSKASELYLILALNFIDFCLLKALLFCILFSLWTYFFTLEHEVWLGGGWPTRSTRPPHTLCL